jgi:murein DD-endopeptidase MepM/ murein hydrolase activator NlpD
VHFIITDAWVARSRAIHLSGRRLALSLAAVSLALATAAAGLYHWVFLKAAREGWPIVGPAVRLITRDEAEQRDRFLRENLDAMARRVGAMQAKLVQLESLGERVSGLAGVKLADVAGESGQGGALVSGRPLTLGELDAAIADLDRLTGQHTDLLTVIESRLIEQKMGSMMLPTRAPVQGGHLGSAFGWRIDPFTGRSALHTGLDYDVTTGTAVLAAAGGIVVSEGVQSAYGNVVEIDHGNDLVTRYAHLSRFAAHRGDLVKRGQKIAEVGTTGRSTGPHLHFEVLVRGVPQDPQKFLAAARGGLQVAQGDGRQARGARPVPEPPTHR